MIVLIPILSVALSQPAMADYKVVSVERQETYAGKLGHRINQTIVAERDGKRYEIKLRNHTAIRGSVKNYSQGDSIKVDGFTVVREAN